MQSFFRQYSRAGQLITFDLELFACDSAGDPPAWLKMPGGASTACPALLTHRRRARAWRAQDLHHLSQLGPVRGAARARGSRARRMRAILQPHHRAGHSYLTASFKVQLTFGGTSLAARILWTDSAGVEHVGPLSIIPDSTF